MSGLDTSQILTDEASLHAEEHHVHSHESEAKDDKDKVEDAADAEKAPPASG